MLELSSLVRWAQAHPFEAEEAQNFEQARKPQQTHDFVTAKA